MEKSIELDLVWRLVLLALGGTVVASGVNRVREGALYFYGTIVERRKNPISFWSVVVVGLGGGCGLILLALS